MWGFFLLSQTADQCEEGSSPLYGRPKKRCSSRLQEQQKTLGSIASKTLSHTATAQYTASMCVFFLCVHLQHNSSFTHVFICHLSANCFATRLSQKTTITTQHIHTKLLHTVRPLMSLGKGISTAPSSLQIQSCQNIHLLNECIISYRQEVKSTKREESLCHNVQLNKLSNLQVNQLTCSFSDSLHGNDLFHKSNLFCLRLRKTS